jgi:hypothetical protein
MSYLYGAIILIAGIALVLGAGVLIAIIADRIRDLDWYLEGKYKKYKYFKETILPYTIAVIFGGITVAGIVTVYVLVVNKLMASNI